MNSVKCWECGKHYFHQEPENCLNCNACLEYRAPHTHNEKGKCTPLNAAEKLCFVCDEVQNPYIRDRDYRDFIGDESIENDENHFTEINWMGTPITSWAHYECWQKEK